MTVPAMPLAAALTEVLRRGRCHNFHALPGADAVPTSWPGHPALVRSGSHDVSLSLDSFFAPADALHAAQVLAAEAFGADRTHFLSCGTTGANRIALDALCGSGGSVLVDPTSHQSVFTAAHTFAGEVRYAPSVVSGRTRTADIGAAVRMLADRRAAGRPFDVIALNGASYDGMRLRLAEVLPLIADAAPETAVLVDEAWSAVHCFAPGLAAHSALRVARGMARAPTTVVTHSAHKTLCALRQASYLHVIGSPATAAAIRSAIYANHTTSPSWPVLVSLDVARAHAVDCGREAVDRALRLRDLFTGVLAADERTAECFRPVREDPGEFYVPDPMKLRLTTAEPAGELRQHLYDEHNVHLPACGSAELLVNFHIGVSEQDVRALAAGLAGWAGTSRSAVPGHRRGDPAIGSVVTEHVLPYPPGVPIAMPGETWTGEHAARLRAARANGAEIFRIEQRGPRGADGT